MNKSRSVSLVVVVIVTSAALLLLAGRFLGKSQVGQVQVGTARLHLAAAEGMGAAIHLRNDGLGCNIGYCWKIQRSDGKVVTLDYYRDESSGPDRYIGVTIWQPQGKDK